MSAFLPKDYGYCFSVLGGSMFMNIYLSIQVSLARQKYGVKYPALYAIAGQPCEKEGAKDKVLTKEDADSFNCVQRGHQQMLESYHIVMTQMMFCGLVSGYTIPSAVCGGIWVVGKAIYGWGYAKYGSNGRHAGGIISHLGDLPLWAITLKIAYEMVTGK